MTNVGRFSSSISNRGCLLTLTSSVIKTNEDIEPIDANLAHSMNQQISGGEKRFGLDLRLDAIRTRCHYLVNRTFTCGSTAKIFAFDQMETVSPVLRIFCNSILVLFTLFFSDASKRKCRRRILYNFKRGSSFDNSADHSS